MKILLIVIGGFLLVCLSLVVIGSLLPKRHVASRSASYHATPEQLFSLISGAQNWRSDVVQCETLPDHAGRELMRETTKNHEAVTYELLDSVPPKSLTRRIATPNLPFSGSWTFSLQPSGETTVVRITENGEVHSPVFRFASLFLGHTRTIDGYLNALGEATKQKVEVRD
jgi:Polyketide cyclase / dehydrase and lipid transport